MAKRKKRTYSKKKKIENEPFSFLRFFLSFRAEIITIICVIVGVRIVASLGVKKEAREEIDFTLNEVPAKQKDLWAKQYPSGYKIIAITDKGVVQTGQDTLPEDLKIDWHNVLVSVIPADPLKQTEEKIKITIPVVSYDPVNIYNLSVSGILTRGQRDKVGLAKFGWHNLMVEIIGDDGDQLLCLVGFQ